MLLNMGQVASANQKNTITNKDIDDAIKGALGQKTVINTGDSKIGIQTDILGHAKINYDENYTTPSLSLDSLNNDADLTMQPYTIPTVNTFNTGLMSGLGQQQNLVTAWLVFSFLCES